MTNKALSIFNQLRPVTVGFDNVFDHFERMMDDHNFNEMIAVKYPPYNIVKTGDYTYDIELALAGIDKEALDIELNQNQLTISTKKVEAPTDEGKFEDKITELEYLHKGISNRSFSRAFTLADHVIVTGADMRNGILKVNLERQLPEELKPRKIDISSDK